MMTNANDSHLRNGRGAASREPGFYGHHPAAKGRRGARKIEAVDRYIYIIGIALLYSFFFPVLISNYGGKVKLLFLNIQWTLQANIDWLLKLQLLYPLLAGFSLTVLAKRKRSPVKALAIAGLGVLPFLLFLVSDNTRYWFRNILRRILGPTTLEPIAILSALAVAAILAGAHVSRLKPKNNNATLVAASGAGLYILLRLIPVRGEFHFLIPLQMMFSRSSTYTELQFLSGLVALTVLVLMIIICYKSVLLVMKASHEKIRVGTSIIKLWFAQFYVYGGFLLYVAMVTTRTVGVSRGTYVIAMLLSIIKFFPWIMGLFLLIPIGLSELLLLAQEPAPAPPPFGKITADKEEEDKKSPAPSYDRQLEELTSLFSNGLISGEEYKQRKLEILKKM
jgi:hypothetical protein